LIRNAKQKELEQMADEVFELTKLSWLARHGPKKKGTVDLTESEFLALDFLAKTEPLTVGQLQKRLRVQPAQMSRVIRSLESKVAKPLVRCEINSQDKRRVDVYLTELGQQARNEYRNARLASSLAILGSLSDGDRREFMRILSQIRDMIAESLRA
jgi:DNA-binding MarR family transcriptional regulator